MPRRCHVVVTAKVGALDAGRARIDLTVVCRLAPRCWARRRVHREARLIVAAKRSRTLTSIAVGGPAPHLIRASEPAELIDAAREAWADAAGWLLLGGGSNLVVSRRRIRGPGRSGGDPRRSNQLGRIAGHGHGTVRLRVQAGEPWDGVVAYAVATRPRRH